VSLWTNYRGDSDISKIKDILGSYSVNYYIEQGLFKIDTKEKDLVCLENRGIFVIFILINSSV